MLIHKKGLFTMRAKPASLELSATIGMIANERKLFKSKKRKGIMMYFSIVSYEKSGVVMTESIPHMLDSSMCTIVARSSDEICK